MFATTIFLIFLKSLLRYFISMNINILYRSETNNLVNEKEKNSVTATEEDFKTLIKVLFQFKRELL